MDQLPEHELMQRWWKYMGDIMETNPEGPPKVEPFLIMVPVPEGRH